MEVWCLLLFLLQVPVTWAIEWTSASRLPNGTTIPACPGQDVTMSWSYTAGVAEHLTNVEWHYTPPAIADTGTYTVRVNMDVHGSTVREMQSAEVLVSDQPITTDDQLHVTMLPDAVYVNSTRQYHVQLACGDFLPVWGHRASVVWKTPDNQTLPSTSGENGRFLLSVPIPVVTGEYSCILDDTSRPVCACRVAQIVTLEARMNSYQQENSVLKQQLESQKQEVVAQKQQLETQKQQLETQEQEVENQKHRLENQTQQQEIHRQEVHVLKQQLETMRHNLTSMIDTANLTARNNLNNIENGNQR
nr:hypothetical protein BaRGS_026992 [Batillaria attramentaria]